MCFISAFHVIAQDDYLLHLKKYIIHFFLNGTKSRNSSNELYHLASLVKGLKKLFLLMYNALIIKLKLTR